MRLTKIPCPACGRRNLSLLVKSGTVRCNSCSNVWEEDVFSELRRKTEKALRVVCRSCGMPGVQLVPGCPTLRCMLCGFEEDMHDVLRSERERSLGLRRTDDFPQSPQPFPEYTGALSTDPSSRSRRVLYEPDERERRSLYWKSFSVSAVLILSFVLLTASLPSARIPWETFSLAALAGALLVSRMADIWTTQAALASGGIETNPASAPRDITRLLRGELSQDAVLLLAAYLLRSLSLWLGNGLLLWATMMSLRAALSNLTQPLAGFLLNAALSSLAVCVLAYSAWLLYLRLAFG